ncbi:allophanate hydrolase [Sulfurimonas aquatica]|uniref:Allophanate hydrolase n=1 Tax=Sulfurimonas aquatica TaxID=2672570 RepID=A0A975GBP5_9BACT|nr:allophanate hydrolase [Sulfurimonas aquatica]QSZ40657.1 allophanate hydrolase [Sulfurimonas aquatica]
MTISSLQKSYKDKELSPRELMQQIKEKIEIHKDNPIWIHVLSEDELEPYLKRLESSDVDSLPLYGVPFAIKDNIDLKDIPTTAACPDYSYVPDKSAYVVEQLINAGAIPVGKTNLDQFATGLVGTRSPYGACQNSINAEYISGGSSSGSAVSVALDMALFSLGTDTAGSGRVPAAFNNLVGVKPSKGILSTSGVVPACRSLDCVSIFAKNSEDASRVLDIAISFDESDPYSRVMPDVKHNVKSPFSFAIVKQEQLKFFEDNEAEELYKKAVKHFEMMGGKALEIDFSPMLEAANLLYYGPWVTERYVALKDMVETKPESFMDVTKTIVLSGKTKSAEDYFNAEYKIKAYKRQADILMKNIDFALTPTTGTIYTIDEVNADPIELNSNLGYYTNFMNLLDFSAYAIPAGFRKNGLPFGVTLFAEAFEDRKLINYGKLFTSKDFNV